MKKVSEVDVCMFGPELLFSMYKCYFFGVFLRETARPLAKSRTIRIFRIRIRINFIFTHVAVDTNNILQYSFKHEIIVCKSMNIIYCTI